MESALTWLGSQPGDVNTEKPSHWKCEVRGPKGVADPSSSPFFFLPGLRGLCPGSQAVPVVLLGESSHAALSLRASTGWHLG